MCLIKLHCDKKVKGFEREISILESQIIILLGAYMHHLKINTTYPRCNLLRFAGLNLGAGGFLAGVV